MKQCCRTCHWARWERSRKNGRRLFNRSGKCAFPLPVPEKWPESVPDWCRQPVHRTHVTTTMGETCECWKTEEEEKPL